ncbi:nucleotidyl transferase AbiEii/AbiGii toxin family protein [Streptomyces filipinensis]|uniref:nucleotidyl transferase AbiEii/AbiGii toxin family protein n=1 Tax=Streptomyces filipinensis TaxID=66887 RepID=UPI0036E33F40
MDELHDRLIRVGPDALADHGFALAGAIKAHHILDRLSDDVDLLTSLDRRAEMPAAEARIGQAYEEAGYTVEHVDSSDTYVRLYVTDSGAGRTNKVELVAETLDHQPVPSEFGPVLHRDDVAAGKIEALFSRAELRDFIDVDALIKAGYTRDQLLRFAAHRDAGFDRRVFADMLGSVTRFRNDRFAPYGITPEAADAIKEQFAEWRQELSRPAE